MGVNRASIAVSLVLALACSAEAPETPTETVRAFLDAMDRSASDARELARAYGLLDEGARSELRRRAHKAETLTGRAFEPWEMLAQGRFRLRFAPAPRGGMRERQEGEQAVVVVTGAEGERAEVPLVREAGRWRIRLPIPTLGEAAGERPAQ